MPLLPRTDFPAVQGARREAFLWDGRVLRRPHDAACPTGSAPGMPLPAATEQPQAQLTPCIQDGDATGIPPAVPRRAPRDPGEEMGGEGEVKGKIDVQK